MGKYHGFTNRFEKFFSSDQGQKLLNYAYGFGAAIVILGALFKILHLKGADLMLCVGMGTEALIFALSAFDKPATNYHWERVFPVLQDAEAQITDISKSLEAMMNRTSVNNGAVTNNAQQFVNNTNMQGANIHPNNIPNIQNNQAGNNQVNGNISFSVSPELNNATELYVVQIKEMAEQMTRLKEITSALTNASSTLLSSYSAINENSDDINNFSMNYVKQMGTLNQNITGLNTIYEIQLKSVSAQLDTIDKVNSGLSNIRSLYDNSTMDSFKIRQETEKMTMNLSQLNKIYERMLSAMTVNMHNPANFR